MLYNLAVKVTDAPVKWAPMICPFLEVWQNHFPGAFVLTTAEHNLYNTDMQTREYTQWK